MNHELRYLFGIYQISLVLRETLEYFFPQDDENSVKKYYSRRNILNEMLKEGTPFRLFCKSNGDKMDKLLENIQNFTKDVYSPESTIITVRNNNGKEQIYVEDSLYINLLDYIVGIRENFNQVISGFVNQIDQDGKMEPDFKKLMTVDERFYRAFVLKVCAISINSKFKEYNAAINDFFNSNKEFKGQIDKANEDPSVKFIARELSRIIELTNFVIKHSNETDVAFTSAVKNYQDAIQCFFGKVKFSEFEFLNNVKPENDEDFFKKFANIFTPILVDSHNTFGELFIRVFNDLNAFENAIRNNEVEKYEQEHKTQLSEETKQENK